MTIRSLILSVVRALLIFCAAIYLLQDILLFPGTILPFERIKPPKDIESQFISTTDSENIEVWRLEPGNESKGVALFLHGNGGPLPMWLPFQRWLGSLGYVTYSFDYRGYGNSSGWPSEQGIIEDTRAVAQHIVRREAIAAEELMVVGFSIGSGPAAEIAAELQSKTLVLLAPYASLKQRAREEPLIGLLSPLLRYNYNTATSLHRLPSSSCVILAHGEKDGIIGYHHSEQLLQTRPKHTKYLLFSEVRHNDLVFRAHWPIGEAINHCAIESTRETLIKSEAP